MLSDNIPEPEEKVFIILRDVIMDSIENLDRRASLDLENSVAEIIILPNGFSYGVFGWHPDFLRIITLEPQSKQVFKLPDLQYISKSFSILTVLGISVCPGRMVCHSEVGMVVE